MGLGHFISMTALAAIAAMSPNLDTIVAALGVKATHVLWLISWCALGFGAWLIKE